MPANTQTMMPLQNPFKLDLRSLAIFRLGLGLVILLALFPVSTFSLATPLDTDLSKPIFYENASNLLETFIQQFGFGYFLLGLLLLVSGIGLMLGYKTRIATLSCLILSSIASLVDVGHFPLIATVLLALLFWSLFLPVGANYSLDSAMNLGSPPKTEVAACATASLVLQQCLNYWMLGSPFLLSIFDQTVLSNASPEGWRSLIRLSPYLLLIPVGVTVWRLSLVVLLVITHIVLLFILAQPLVVTLLAITTWLAFVPRAFWDRLGESVNNPERENLTIYYDADCGFCKKVVHVLRTLLILPSTILLTAQSDASICRDMETYNSWIVVDWQGGRHYKFAAIAYIVSLSPVFHGLAPLLKLSPVMAPGTRLYEVIANHRKQAGRLTRPLKFNYAAMNISKVENFFVLVMALAYFSVNFQLAFS